MFYTTISSPYPRADIHIMQTRLTYLMQLEEKGTMTIGKPQKGFIDEGERTEEKKVRQLRKEEFVINPICMTMNKAKLKPRFNVQKQKKILHKRNIGIKEMDCCKLL